MSSCGFFVPKAAGNYFHAVFLFLKEVERAMTINLLFITITIERRKPTVEEIEHQRYVRELEEEMFDRKCRIYKEF